jgi:DNA gyrase/topoisomerase IV subunit B
LYVLLCLLLGDNKQVTFVPDVGVFTTGVTFDADTIASRLRELAFLNAGATLKLRLLKHGEPVQQQQPASAAKARASKRSSTTQQQEEGAAAGSSGTAAAAAAEGQQQQQEWQVFLAQDGLREYVQW